MLTLNTASTISKFNLPKTLPAPSIAQKVIATAATIVLQPIRPQGMNDDQWKIVLDKREAFAAEFKGGTQAAFTLASGNTTTDQGAPLSALLLKQPLGSTNTGIANQAAKTLLNLFA